MLSKVKLLTKQHAVLIQAKRCMKDVALTGAPFSGGQPKAGVEKGPQALHDAGIITSIEGLEMARNNSETPAPEVHLPMILKMEKICKGYIDQLENGGKHFNIQNFMMMYIFGSTNNTEYRTKLFDYWPTYLEDFEACQPIMNYRYPETLCDEFVNLKLDKNVKILDVACGPGNVTYILRNHGYTNIDGLDPSQGLLDAAQTKNLYKQVFCTYVMHDKKTEEVPDATYDVLLCCAGMFPGSIVPQAFTELIRMVSIGGILSWNIADGYEGFNDFFLEYDSIIKDLIVKGVWEELQPVKKLNNMLFEDAGYTHVMKRLK